MDAIRKTFSRQSDEDEEERSIVTEVLDASSLSWETRLKGFIFCFVLGIILSVLGTILFWSHNGLMAFAILYTFGNIVCIASTMFLKGPVAQVKSMFKETRLIATILVFLFIGLTLMAAFWWHKKPLVLLFCIMEFLAFTWYGLSYIPFARDAVKKCVGTCLV